jgi:hypothetical protein
LFGLAAKAIAKTPINPNWRIATGCMTAQTTQMIYNVALKMPKALTTRASRNVRIDAKRAMCNYWRAEGEENKV